MQSTMHATTAMRLAQLAAEVHEARAFLSLSQNGFARRAGIDPSILSRLLGGKATAGPSERKLRTFLRRTASRRTRES